MRSMSGGAGLSPPKLAAHIQTRAGPGQDTAPMKLLAFGVRSSHPSPGPHLQSQLLPGVPLQWGCSPEHP